MIQIISAQNPSMESPVDGRFGRSPWLIRMDTSSGQWQAYENPGAAQSGGAGVAAAQFAIDQKVNIVISGDFGPHAANAFHAANVEMRLFTAEVITVRQAIDGLAGGKLPAFS